MPKKPFRLKYFHDPETRALPRGKKNPTSVSDLLEQAPGLLARLREGTGGAERALAALRRQLPEELAAQVWGASLKDGTLTAMVQSGAWATRLRYVAPRIAPAIAEELQQPVARVRVRVRAAR